ncbi:MAG TPA: Xaa-Pro peptidase family protein [Chloroflexota bacterium]|nr:Xaa-Pro peptidase family protein [Chloroflexota bacterium]
MSTYSARISRAREVMDRLGIDLLYLAPGANAQYLSGWRRNRPHFGNVNYPGGWIQGLFVGLTRGPVLAVPRMVADFDLEPDTNLDVRALPDQGDPTAFLDGVLREFEPRLGAIAIENRAWSEQALALRQVRPDAEVRLASEVLGPLRMIKAPAELDLLERAAAIVDQTMTDIVSFLDPDSGQTELDVAYEIDRLMMRAGADGSSFVTNVWQMGPGELRPLAMKASRRPLARGNSLSFDFGATFAGYCYDFGRSVHLGNPPDEYRRVHALVMRAAQIGIEALQDGQHTAEEVDALARQVVVDGGYGEWFRHRLGHGIGLDVHEPPYLDRGDRSLLQRGMCFTVEPSIFIPGRFGARTEDVVVVGGAEGGRVLTHYRRDLQVVP